MKKNYDELFATIARLEKRKPKGGAVKGHKGHFRKSSDHVDRIAISKISQCQYCGSRDLNERSFHSFDQIDIPEIKSLVTGPWRYKYRRKKKLKDILYDAFANGSDKMSRFADRLLIEFEKLFLFTRYRMVEPTNNAAERSLRHIVLWKKTSYGTQSKEGSHFIERAMSIWMTLKKQGREALGFFQNAYLSTFNSEIQTPSI